MTAKYNFRMTYNFETEGENFTTSQNGGISRHLPHVGLGVVSTASDFPFLGSAMYSRNFKWNKIMLI